MTDIPEFDLAIQAFAQGYTVSLRAAAGVDLPPQPISIPFALPALPEYREIARFVAAAREARLSAAAELRDAQQLGGMLFQAIFPPEVLARFRAAREALPNRGRLAVRLRLPAELSAIPWELLYDRTNDQFLALSDDLALLRCPEMAAPLRPLQLNGSLQLVVVLASPRGQRPIDLDRELARVEAALRQARANGQVELHVIRGPGTYEQLRERLDEPMHVLHVLCHGDLDSRRGEGVLLFEDISGDKELISAAQLRMLLEKQRGQTRLVVLNSCLGAVSGGNDPFGSVGLALMRAGVPAVLAMQFEFPMDSANELTRILYADLVKGRPIDVALTEARRHLYGIDSYRLDWAIPALFLRGNDGALFQPAPATASSVPEHIPAPEPVQEDKTKTEIERLEELRRNHQRRLHVLELQKARYGISTPPEIELEIQDINKELARIAQLLQQLAWFSPASTPQPTQQAARAPALSALELRGLRQRASAAYYARRWEEAERLLTQLVAADPNDTEARERLHTLMRYREIKELREAGDWEAVLGALAEFTHQHASFGDPQHHAMWAETCQRRDRSYEAALQACEQADWATVERLLTPLVQSYPNDRDMAELLQRARDELALE